MSIIIGWYNSEKLNEYTLLKQSIALPMNIYCFIYNYISGGFVRDVTLSTNKGIKAEYALVEYRNLAFIIPHKSKDSLFSATAERFDRDAYALLNYYNVWQAGIESGYFDKQLCETFLHDKLNKHIDILFGLQHRHTRLYNKMVIQTYIQQKKD